MALDITTPKATAPTPPEPERVSGWELFRWVYRFFYSKTVGLVLILAMALLVMIGTLLQPQLTSAVKADPDQYQQFLDQWRSDLGPFGFLTTPMKGLGLFDIYRSPLFVTVAALLAASILACTAHRFPLLWKNWRHPRLVVPTRAYEAARYRASVPVDRGDVKVMATVGEVLKKQRYRVLTDPAHPKAVYADRYAWGGMGAVVAHLSFVIIIGALVLSMNGGIDKTLFVPVGGDPVAVGSGTSLSVAATAYETKTRADGRPTDYVSHLVVTKNGKKVAERDVRVNSPLSVGGVSFHQSSYQSGVIATATGPDGVLFDGFSSLDYDLLGDGTMAAAVVEVLPASGAAVEDPTSDDGSTTTSDAALDLVVAVPTAWDPVTVARSSDLSASEMSDMSASSATADPFVIQPGQALLRLYKGNLLLGEEQVDAGGSWVVGSYTFTFAGEQESPWIGIRQDPGALWMWLGSALLVIGMTVTFACRHRRLWATWDDEEKRVRFASTDKSDTVWARRFRATVEAVAQQVDSAAHHGPAPSRTAGGTEVVDEDVEDEQAEVSTSTDPEGTKEKTDE